MALKLDRIDGINGIRYLLGIAVSIFIGVSALVFLISQADGARLLATGRQISLPFLTLSFACYGATWVLRTWRLGLLLTLDPHCLSWWSLYRVQIAGFAINALFPAKMGEVALVVFLRSAGIRGSGALAAVFQARLFDVLALMAMMICSGVILLGKSFVPWRWSILFSVLFLVLLPMTLVTLDKRFRFEEWLAVKHQKNEVGRLQWFLGKMSDTWKAYRAIVANRQLFFFSFFQSLVLWFGEITVTVLVSLAVGIPNAYLPWLFLAVPLANIGKAFPITPGGIGVYEGLMATTLHSAGLAWEFAIAIGIIDHLLKKSWTVAWGTPLVLRQIKTFGWAWLDRGGG